ncbi:DegT/DnrJ/EryC1/StrS family aminotransferase [Legionella fallonii]|uniref:DegT/DnrJ/EryC1/StrS aminotransferase n=1 Tax=Legionella fallonii LLAP-10 TaxID=1212491 RepID=A0A098G8D4_9GAMM|nr:DegT/DnrJ/EryC1/StrS family aminotransferase [Legionella fallonii]CEG58743.1 protein of unknown function [Legionella fallonii LLAP-10]
MKQLRCVWFTKAKEIDDCVWNKLLRDERHAQSWYSALDQANLSDKTQFYYGVFYDGNEPVALIPAFLKLFPIDFIMPDLISKLVGFIDKYIYDIRYKKVLFIGSYVDYGVIGINEQYSFEQIQPQISNEIDLQSKRLAASIIVWKDFPIDVRDLFKDEGFITCCSFPDVYNEIKGSSFEEYVHHKPYLIRKKIKRKIKEYSADSYEFFSIQQPDVKELEPIYDCFAQIEKKYDHHKLKFEQVNFDYFKSSSADSHFIYLGLRDKQSKTIINVVQCIQTPDRLFQVFYGFNCNEFSARGGYYFLLQKKVIEYCIKHGIKTLYDGQNQYTPKLDMGGQLFPLYNAIKCYSPVLHWFLSKLMKNLRWSDLSPELATYFNAHPDALPHDPPKLKRYDYWRALWHSLPPTAGYRIYFRDFFIKHPSMKEAKITQEELCKKSLAVSFVHLTSSGTAALFIILQAIKTLTEARTVIVPAYTCPLVALAIARAGFQMRLCDSNGVDFNFDTRQLTQLCHSSTDIAAILITHLGGIPANINDVDEVIKQTGKNIFLIEDAAQSFGSMAKNKPVGASGDFAVFSFAAGKGATLYEGGLVVSKQGHFIGALQNAIASFEQSKPWLEVLRVLQLFGYWLFYRPGLFFGVYTLPQAFWAGKNNMINALGEDFSSSFPVHKVSNLRVYLGFANFNRTAGEIAHQRQQAKFYLQALSDNKTMQVLGADLPDGDRVTYPFISLLIAKNRERLFPNLALQALGVSLLFAKVLPEYPYLKRYLPGESPENYPNAVKLCETLTTLTTTRFIKPKEIYDVVRLIRALVETTDKG